MENIVGQKNLKLEIRTIDDNESKMITDYSNWLEMINSPFIYNMRILFTQYLLRIELSEYTTETLSWLAFQGYFCFWFLYSIILSFSFLQILLFFLLFLSITLIKKSLKVSVVNNICLYKLKGFLYFFLLLLNNPE